jgi:ABC-2 type transport system ATP-binding protein
LLEQFELLDRRDALAQELSRGMRQKVAICCSYLYEPKVILFDEPHTGLDPHGIRTMKETVMQRAASGAAVIVSSHLLGLIEDLCTHLLILQKGKALFLGTMNEAREMYPETGDGMTLEEIFFRTTTELELPPGPSATTHLGASEETHSGLPQDFSNKTLDRPSNQPSSDNKD